MESSIVMQQCEILKLHPLSAVNFPFLQSFCLQFASNGSIDLKWLASFHQ